MGLYSDYILVSDFDQTMTDFQSRIPQANLDAIRHFMAEGGIFTLATGRSLPMSRYRFQEVPMNAPLIVYNGAACVELSTDELLFCHPLPEDCVPFIQYYEKKYPDLRLEIHCLDAHYIFHSDKGRDEYLERQRAKYAYVDWPQVPEPKVKFCLYYPHENLYAIEAHSEIAQFLGQLTDDINRRGQGRYLAMNTLPGLVEVQVTGTSKGQAARELANRMGRKTLVCVGDAINDLSMLEEADLAFIPRGCDPRMEGHGFRPAAPCTEGTVADVIRQLV